ncbi:hypothetical protein OROMI_027153 [Orobanche minor]
MSSNKYLMIFFSLTITLLFATAPTTAAGANVTAVFTFGDSILDSGNNNHLPTIFRSNHSPYGLDFPGGVPTGRFSDGRLSTDMLVSELGIKQLLPAYLDPALTDKDLLSGVSFASAGTGLDDLTAIESRVLSLNMQLGYFDRALRRMRRVVGSSEAGRVVENALFMVAAGTNDMVYNFYGLPLRRSYTLSGYHDMLLRNLEGVIRKMAVMGLPPVGCLPIQVTLGSVVPSFHMFRRVCVNQQNSDSQAYNAKLENLISRLQRVLPASRIAYVDIYNPIMDMIQRPAAFGFEKTLEGCCGVGALEMGPLCNALDPTCPDPSKYIFWDAVHPTQATYTILARHFQENVLPGLLS